MKNETRATEPESYPMRGGDGAYSYAKNSSYQGEGAAAVKVMVDEEIYKSLDVAKLSLISNTLCLADLGCSTGPNTFIHMQDLIESINRKYLSQQGASTKLPEFQVFFNDHSLNDFNTLFTSLPPERQYFAAGVPGSFHGRLFPSSSLHLVYSSYALQWMSKPPQQCLDKNSDAYNKGKIHYFGAPSVVVEAYAAQFASDMDAFFEARAHEVMAGGMMVLIMLGSPKDVSHSSWRPAYVFRVLESTLLDMAKMGIISESKVNSFNIPVYAACPEEITMAVEKNGNFTIEKLELTCVTTAEHTLDLKALALHMRAGFEALISKHFGNEIMDELFDRFYIKLKENYEEYETCHLDKSLLFAVLKRK